MLKLYKNIDGILHYWETWDKNKKTGIVHWGIAGQTGESKEVSSTLLQSFTKKIQKEVSAKINERYTEIDIDDHFTLLIEFEVDGMGSNMDLDKRARLQDKMDSVLGWAGLGHCDGGSIGSGTMEVCCYVVDFDIAKKVITESLNGTEFADYTRIYDGDAE
ncbi:hypothetical protein [Mucilaginibacter sp.]|jgi:hypothetical protein|uniref:hypothetical protein n=1 Tax=Mucilaginibacter sp. TaxID=1882438 RepID=UPI002C786333|nr:hypothetical protein [Mucilaginibacter sp.]HTI61164.1 hypothetical protein [Mucilaginibacter sp.]